MKANRKSVATFQLTRDDTQRIVKDRRNRGFLPFFCGWQPNDSAFLANRSEQQKTR